MEPLNIVIAATQVPFMHGGAEWHVEALRQQLSDRGHRVDVVQIPFQWSPREEVFRSALAWRFLDLTQANGVPVDLVIATRFPSYVLRHPNKIVWLFHQFRQAYDLHEAGIDGFPRTPEGEALRQRFIELDNRVLGECRRIFTTSDNNARRLRRHNQLEAEILRLPLLAPETYRCDGWDDYVLSVGRLDSLKRTELLVRAAAHLEGPGRVVIVGSGPLEQRIRTLARELGVADRVELLGRVDDATVKALYARCGAVFYAPFDEDYGLVTLEAFQSSKPVVTTTDAGGPLEFVRDGETGFVCDAEPEPVAAALSRLLANQGLAAELGDRGRASIASIGWNRVVEALTAPRASSS